MTIVGRLCEKLVEAGWLTALVLVVTFLNPFSEQVFEPDKAALFRSLVILMTAAWVIRTLDTEALVMFRSSGEASAGKLVARVRQTVREIPIAGFALFLLLIYIISTITSVSPRVSWWGSYQRAQGTYTFLTYLGLFFIVLLALRRADQLHRLMTVLLFTSFPVAVYAIFQHYGITLLQFSGADVEVRVISTLGNAIFLAAYLAMVIPLAVWRFLESARAWPARTVRSTLAFVVYGGLLVVQLAAVLFTQSRGPFLGLLVELFVFVLLLALLRRRRGWALAGVLAAVVVIVLLLALNLPGLPADPLRNLPFLTRFSRISGAGVTEVQARILAWDTTLDAVRAEPGRTLSGYGPETMKAILTRFMPGELWVLQGGGQFGTFDRAHNAVFDALFTQGVIGVVAYLFLYGLIFYQSIRWLGLAQTQRESRALIGLLAGGTALGLMIPRLWRGDLALGGVGMPAGMIAGLVLYLVGQAVFLTDVRTTRAPAVTSAEGEMRPLLLAALLAAIAGHFVEMQTGIGIFATEAYFWLYLALIILLGTGRIGELEPGERSELQPAKPGGTRRGRPGRRRKQDTRLSFPSEGLGPVIAMALVVAALLGTLSYAFVHGFNVPGARGPAQVLIVATWLLTGCLVLLEQGRIGAGISSLEDGASAYALASLSWLLPFVLYHRANARVLENLNAAFLAFVVWLLLTVIAIALALQWGEGPARPATQSNRAVLYVAVVLLAAVLAWRVDITRVRADIYEKVGKTAMGAGLWDQAIPNLERAVHMQSRQPQYYIFLGGAYLERARLTSNQAEKNTWIERVRQVLEQGWALAPHDSDQPRQLGLMYRVWADWETDGTTRRQRLQQSLDHFLAAVELNPENPDLRLDLGGAYLALGDYQAAFTQYRHAVAIGSPYHLGRANAGLGNVYLAQGRLDEAAEAYREAMRAGLDREEVLQAQSRASVNHPEDIRAREGLALLYAAAGRTGDALEELNEALAIASSDEEQAELEKLIMMIEK